MIFKRVSAGLRAQNWMAVLIEFAIVVAGVFVGTQVSNWNSDRLAQAETVRMLRSLKPELINQVRNLATVRDYYGVTRRYGDTAFAGWRSENNVSDRDFVIAAYQASQNTFTGINNSSWSQLFGAGEFRGIRDQQLRNELSVLMTSDYAVIEKELFSRYREDVRMIIPEDIQDLIREECGDQRIGTLGFVRLPTRCEAQLPEARWREGAAALRAHPELAEKLRWHFAAVATYLFNTENLATISRSVVQRIDRI